jgi:hypothetical protein
MPLNLEPERSEYLLRVTGFLVKKDIVGDLEDIIGQKGIFGMGDSALEPFKPREDWEPWFNSCAIWIFPQITIVPEDPTPLEPRCPDCLADVTEPLYKVYFPGEETPFEKINFGSARVTCPECQGTFGPDKLRDERGKGIFLTNRYVCFQDAGEFRTEWLAEFSLAVGTPHRGMALI